MSYDGLKIKWIQKDDTLTEYFTYIIQKLTNYNLVLMKPGGYQMNSKSNQKNCICCFNY